MCDEVDGEYVWMMVNGNCYTADEVRMELVGLVVSEVFFEDMVASSIR